MPASSTQTQSNHSLFFASFILEGSLAVLSNAAHLATNLSPFIIAIIGSCIASFLARASHTFGLKHTESLATLFFDAVLDHLVHWVSSEGYTLNYCMCWGR